MTDWVRATAELPVPGKKVLAWHKTHVAVTEGEVSWWMQLPEGPGHHG